MSGTVRFFFIHAPSRDSWQVENPVAWCLEHARVASILAPASERLVTLEMSDVERVIRLVTRRCRLNLIEVLPGRVVVHFWGQGQAELRPFFKEHSLARSNVEVFLLNRKSESIAVCPGTDFLFGTHRPDFPLATYRGKYERRYEQEADDWTPAPLGGSNFSWDGVPDHLTPWAALKELWLRDQPPLCQNCDVPLVILWLWWRRPYWPASEAGHINRLCLTCRCLFMDDTHRNLLAWIVRTLDRRFWPTHHHMNQKYALTECCLRLTNERYDPTLDRAKPSK